LTEFPFSARIERLRDNYTQGSEVVSSTSTRKTRILSTVSQDGNLKIAPGHTSVARAALLRARNGTPSSIRWLFLCRLTDPCVMSCLAWKS